MNTESVLNNIKILTEENLWGTILSRQGDMFYTAKKLPFTYEIRGGEMFVDRRSKSITKATILKAYLRVQEDAENRIKGPKALNCFGAPYIWAVFQELGVTGSKPGTDPLKQTNHCITGQETMKL